LLIFVLQSAQRGEEEGGWRENRITQKIKERRERGKSERGREARQPARQTTIRMFFFFRITEQIHFNQASRNFTPRTKASYYNPNPNAKSRSIDPFIHSFNHPLPIYLSIPPST
jgi:hypothetical protein